MTMTHLLRTSYRRENCGGKNLAALVQSTAADMCSHVSTTLFPIDVSSFPPFMYCSPDGSCRV